MYILFLFEWLVHMSFAAWFIAYLFWIYFSKHGKKGFMAVDSSFWFMVWFKKRDNQKKKNPLCKTFDF